MLEENDGWATFITTPRGRNHAKALFDMAKKDMDSGGRWFAEISSVHETGALSANQITESLAEYIALYGEDIGTAQFEQEYRSEEHTSELQSLMRISYAVFCFKKNTITTHKHNNIKNQLPKTT